MMFETKIKKEKVSYKDEIEHQRSTESERYKKEREVFQNRKSYNSNSFVIVFLILMTALMVGTVIYAVYAVVHVTRVSDLAGVHVTPVLKKAKNSLLNEGSGSDVIRKKPGYENWLIYKNGDFMAMYPPEWEVKINGDVIFKRYGDAQFKRYDSLATTMTFGEFDNPSKRPLQEILAANHRKVGENATEEMIGGKKALRTGQIMLDSGLMADGIYWALEQKIFYLETVFYNKKIEGLETDCQKVIDSLKFMQ